MDMVITQGLILAFPLAHFTGLHTMGIMILSTILFITRITMILFTVITIHGDTLTTAMTLGDITDTIGMAITAGITTQLVAITPPVVIRTTQVM